MLKFIQNYKIIMMKSNLFSIVLQPSTICSPSSTININLMYITAWTAICVQNVDVHVSCSSHDDAQFAAFFIDP